MPVFKATKIPTPIVTADELLASFCYHFPQYSFAQARQLPFKRIKLLLNTARKEQARTMLDLLRVFNGSQSKEGVDNVVSYFKDIVEE